MIGNGQNYITLFLMITPDIPAQTAEDYEVIFSARTSLITLWVRGSICWLQYLTVFEIA